MLEVYLEILKSCDVDRELKLDGYTVSIVVDDDIVLGAGIVRGTTDIEYV